MIIEIIVVMFIIMIIFSAFIFLNLKNGIILATILVFILIYLLIKVSLNGNKLQICLLKFKISSLEFSIILSIVLIFLVVISTFNSIMYKFKKDLNVTQKVNIYLKVIKFDEIKFKDSKSLTNNYVTFYYENGDENTVQLINTYFSEVESSTNVVFGKDHLVPLKVVIFSDSKALRNKFIVNDTADSVFSEDRNSISIIKYTNTIPKSEYKKLFFHEYTHYRTSLYLKNNNIINDIPIWFEEGIAEYIGKGKSANASFKLEKIKNFSYLNTTRSFVESDRAPFDIYLQSYLAVNKMVNMKGNQIICDILNETKKIGFYNAFKLKMRMSIETFEKIFLQ